MALIVVFCLCLYHYWISSLYKSFDMKLYHISYFIFSLFLVFKINSENRNKMIVFFKGAIFGFIVGFCLYALFEIYNTENGIAAFMSSFYRDPFVFIFLLFGLQLLSGSWLVTGCLALLIDNYKGISDQ